MTDIPTGAGVEGIGEGQRSHCRMGVFGARECPLGSPSRAPPPHSRFGTFQVVSGHPALVIAILE
jgi:hypothetical protein